jgi:hypothetical protein
MGQARDMSRDFKNSVLPCQIMNDKKYFCFIDFISCLFPFPVHLKSKVSTNFAFSRINHYFNDRIQHHHGSVASSCHVLIILHESVIDVNLVSILLAPLALASLFCCSTHAGLMFPKNICTSLSA